MSTQNKNPIPGANGNGAAKDALLSLRQPKATNLPPMLQRLPDGVSLRAAALVFARELSIDEWQALGAALWLLAGSIQWWIGDWWHYGLHRYGERKATASAKNAFGREYGTLANYGYVAGRVETSRRRETLSWSHHYEVAKLGPEQQEYWLAIAERENLSVRQLSLKIFDALSEDDKTYSYHRFVLRLIEAARRRSEIVEPFDNPELEDFLRQQLLLCSELLETAKDTVDYWSRVAEFARRILSEASVHGEAAEQTVRVAEKGIRQNAECDNSN